LYGLEVFGMKFGLRGIRTLLASIGNPHKNFPSIHIAGTNGKGSTSSMLAAVFTAAGYKTGLYTSPHLVSFAERIRIDGKPIPAKDVVRLISLIKRQVRKQKATYFEAVTAMAFKYFSDSKVDIAVVETGLGGRLDATNVLRPLVSVITNVSLEHTEILGKTLEKISWEKAGIIKHSVPCVTGISSAKPFAVVRDRARTKRAPISTVQGVNLRIRKSNLDGLVVDASVGSATYRNLKVSLVGEHQSMNVRVALRTLDVLKEQGAYQIEERDVRNGLMNIERLTGLQARLSVLQRKPLIIGDVAHNPDSIKRLVGSLRRLKIRNVFLVFGVVRDKDYRRMVHFLKPITRAAILTMARTERARSIADLAGEFSRQRIEVVGTERKVSLAVASAIAIADKRLPILITGSHYVLGEALSLFRSTKFT
jgi:dihydrofolate synthase/folylpolyglutamate synthase